MNKEQKITIFDPAVNAYREVSVEKAKKYIETLEQVKKAVDKVEKNNE